jgi:hypothetical protein
MLNLPESSNFFCSIHSLISKMTIADYFVSQGWQVRKTTWEDFELGCLWAELVLESHDPVLLHGLLMADKFDELLALLNELNIAYRSELYDEQGELIAQIMRQK